MENKKLTYLFRAFFILCFIGIYSIWNVFSDYSESSLIKKEHYLLRFNLNELTMGEVRIVNHNGLPIIIMRRTKQELKQLLDLRSYLSDSDSKHSHQPKFAENYYRSLKSEYFIAYAVTVNLGIEVNYRLENFKHNLDSSVKWYGGFSETLRSGFLYDKAGRSYVKKGMNLDVPNYKITTDNQLYVYTLKELDFD